MTNFGFYVPIGEQLAARLDELPMFQQQRLLELAINKALDTEGWPSGPRGTIAVDPGSWYVVLFRHGRVVGHVGPLHDELAANRCARSWKDGGTTAKVRRQPVGPCLTNKGLQSRDIYYP